MSTESWHFEWLSFLHGEVEVQRCVCPCVLSCWRCTLWKIFFLAFPVYVLVQVPAHLLAENFKTVSIPSVPAYPVALGCVVVPLYLMDFPPFGVYAWLDSGYMDCRI